MNSSMFDIISIINNWVWSLPLVVLCIFSGLYFSFATRFVQIRRIKEMVHLLLFEGAEGEKGTSSFQSFCLALSGKVGVGNIVGVATAIGFGGPGAIVWMWIIAFLGAGSAFAESTLAQIYKEPFRDGYCGGPAFYIEKGLKLPFFAMIFALVMVIGGGSFYPLLQTNCITESFCDSFTIPDWSVGAFIAILLGLVIIGGIKRIAHFTQVVAPLMATLYILIAIIILVFHYKDIPSVFVEMIRDAMGLSPALSGILGSTILFGVKRGIYSNEAGQGTGAIVSGSAGVSHPAKQGLAQSFSVYVDTLFICSATALMILACKTYNVFTPDMSQIICSNPNAPEGTPGILYTIKAIATVFGHETASVIVSCSIFFFAFTTIIAYYYYAESNLVYIMRRILKIKESSKTEKILILTLRLLSIASAFFGSLISSSNAWDFVDLCLGLMVWINVIAILLLSPKAIRVLRDYESQKKKGVKNPVFNLDRLKIRNADFWEQKN